LATSCQFTANPVSVTVTLQVQDSSGQWIDTDGCPPPVVIETSPDEEWNRVTARACASNAESNGAKVCDDPPTTLLIPWVPICDGCGSGAAGPAAPSNAGAGGGGGFQTSWANRVKTRSLE
jgi:hypothetical protein